MLIQGTILKVDPPDYTDNYGNQYQTITIQTAAGPVIGRKASKIPYGVQDINRQVSWECEQKTNNRGAYNKFTKPQDPQYTQPDTPQGQQGPQQAAQRTQANGQPNWDAIAEGKVRCNVICAIMSAGSAPEPTYVNKWVKYIMTGQFPPEDIPSNDIPF